MNAVFTSSSITLLVTNCIKFWKYENTKGSQPDQGHCATETTAHFQWSIDGYPSHIIVSDIHVALSILSEKSMLNHQVHQTFTERTVFIDQLTPLLEWWQNFLWSPRRHPQFRNTKSATHSTGKQLWRLLFHECMHEIKGSYSYFLTVSKSTANMCILPVKIVVIDRSPTCTCIIITYRNNDYHKWQFKKKWKIIINNFTFLLIQGRISSTQRIVKFFVNLPVLTVKTVMCLRQV